MAQSRSAEAVVADSLREKVLLLTEQILEHLEKAGYAISLFAVAVIIVGFAIAAWRYARRFRETAQENNFEQFKIELGGALMLGLEILVLADVIETITVTPTFGSLALLAAIVIVRTAVSWSLALETEGRWPWQAPVEDQESV
jgi:uncharacterized membrane protein